jgi:hypothetical protein
VQQTVPSSNSLQHLCAQAFLHREDHTAKPSPSAIQVRTSAAARRCRIRSDRAPLSQWMCMQCLGRGKPGDAELKLRKSSGVQGCHVTDQQACLLSTTAYRHETSQTALTNGPVLPSCCSCSSVHTGCGVLSGSLLMSCSMALAADACERQSWLGSRTRCRCSASTAAAALLAGLAACRTALAPTCTAQTQVSSISHCSL